MKRPFFGVILILCLLLVSAPDVWGEETAQREARERLDQLISGQTEKLDLEEIEKYLGELDPRLEEHLPRRDLRGFLSDISRRGMVLDFKGIFLVLVEYFFYETMAHFYLLGRIIILAILASVIHTFEKAFETSGLDQISRSVIFLSLILLIMGSFREAFSAAEQTLGDLVGFMQSLIPVLMSLLVAVGGITSTTIIQPVVFLFVNLIGTLVVNVVFPGILISAVLILVGHMVDGFDISRLAGLIRDMSITIMGLSLTVFLGLLMIQGVAGSVADGISIRTVKFLAGNFIPIVGGMFAEAVDVIAGSSLIIKNALGVFGVVVIFLLCAFPILKLLSLVLIYKLAGALVQPVVDENFVSCVNDMGNIMIVILVMLLVVALMFFLTITIIIGVGNFTVMLR